MMEDRITELEMKVAFQDDTINQLDAVICKQQKQIDMLISRQKQLFDFANDSAKDTKATSSLTDDIPPHY